MCSSTYLMSPCNTIIIALQKNVSALQKNVSILTLPPVNDSIMLTKIQRVSLIDTSISACWPPFAIALEKALPMSLCFPHGFAPGGISSTGLNLLPMTSQLDLTLKLFPKRTLTLSLLLDLLSCEYTNLKPKPRGKVLETAIVSQLASWVCCSQMISSIPWTFPAYDLLYLHLLFV